MIHVDEATPRDNEGLLALLRTTPMLGALALRIDRDPDFFHLLELRGDGAVFVARADSTIVGCVSTAFQQVFIDGSPSSIAYIADLRVNPALSRSGAALALVRRAVEHIKTRDVDLAFCVVAAGNVRMLSLLAEGRRGLPVCESVGDFIVSHILPTPRRVRERYDLEETDPRHASDLRSFWNEFNRRYQLGVVTTQAQLEAASGLRILAARRQGEIVATVASFDAGEYKRNVLVRMPRLLSIGLGALRRIDRQYGWPAAGDPIRTLYLRHLACSDGSEGALRGLIQRIRNEAFQKRCACVAVGMHQRDPLRRVIRWWPRYSATAKGFVLSLSGDRALVSRIAAAATMDDFALV
jgi:Acetyltransferase (GNAT) family